MVKRCGVKAGVKNGESYLIQARNPGKVKAIVGLKEEEFNSWESAELWVDKMIGINVKLVSL